MNFLRSKPLQITCRPWPGPNLRCLLQLSPWILLSFYTFYTPTTLFTPLGIRQRSSLRWIATTHLHKKQTHLNHTPICPISSLTVARLANRIHSITSMPHNHLSINPDCDPPLLLNSFEGIVGYLKSRNFNYFLIILDQSIAYYYTSSYSYSIEYNYNIMC